MLRYETLILTVPEITKDEEASLKSYLEKMTKQASGSIISFERWGKYKLAYPIRKNDYGVYYLYRYEVADDNCGALAKEIDAYFKLKLINLVVRSMTSSLPMNASLAYQKPDSLEDAPSHDVDSFLRENKMEGLLSAVPSSESRGSMRDFDDEEA